MRACLLALLLALGACAPRYEPNVSARQRAQCEYDARRATAGTLNSFQQSWEQQDLLRRCLALAEEDNIESKPAGGGAQPAATTEQRIIEKLRPARPEPLPPAQDGPRGVAGAKR